MNINAIQRHEAALDVLWAFFEVHHEQLSSATELLGGECAVQRLARVWIRLGQALSLETHLRRELTWLFELITLQGMGNGALCLDPSDSRVFELCLLADRFEVALKEADRKIYSGRLVA